MPGFKDVVYLHGAEQTTYDGVTASAELRGDVTDQERILHYNK